VAHIWVKNDIEPNMGQLFDAAASLIQSEVLWKQSRKPFKWISKENKCSQNLVDCHPLRDNGIRHAIIDGDLHVAKAKDVYAKLQSDMEAAKKEREAINRRIDREQSDILQSEERIATYVKDILPIVQKQLPQIFNDKVRLEKEVAERVVMQSESVALLQSDLEKASKEYDQCILEHERFKNSEQKELEADPQFIASKRVQDHFDERAEKAVVDDLAAKIIEHEDHIAKHWLMNVAYRNTFGQDTHETRHFIQVLFGQFCLKLKTTERYRSLLREVDVVKSNKELADAKFEIKRTEAIKAKTTFRAMKQESAQKIAVHAQIGEKQKILLETITATTKTALKELNVLRSQADDIQAWKHPTAFKAFMFVHNAIVASSEHSSIVKAAIKDDDKATQLVTLISKEVERTIESQRSIEGLRDESSALAKTIDKLESTSRDMRRKSLNNSSRDIAKADTFMSGGSFESGFDLATLVAITAVIDTVIDTTPSDNSSSSSWSDSSYSSDF
jgi:hypothetical protein